MSVVKACNPETQKFLFLTVVEVCILGEHQSLHSGWASKPAFWVGIKAYILDEPQIMLCRRASKSAFQMGVKEMRREMDVARDHQNWQPERSHPPEGKVVLRHNVDYEPGDPVHAQAVCHEGQVRDGVSPVSTRVSVAAHLEGQHGQQDSQNAPHPSITPAEEEAIQRQEVAEVVDTVEKDALHLQHVHEHECPVADGLVQRTYRTP